MTTARGIPSAHVGSWAQIPLPGDKVTRGQLPEGGQCQLPGEGVDPPLVPLSRKKSPGPRAARAARAKGPVGCARRVNRRHPRPLWFMTLHLGPAHTFPTPPERVGRSRNFLMGSHLLRGRGRPFTRKKIANHTAQLLTHYSTGMPWPATNCAVSALCGPGVSTHRASVSASARVVTDPPTPPVPLWVVTRPTCGHKLSFVCGGTIW